jgi:hypothetical protein
MRRALILLAVLALFAPGSALASGFSLTEADGTFAIKNGSATKIVLHGTGAVVGRFDYGRMWFTDPNLDDGTGPLVKGADERKDLTDTSTYFGGFDVKFRSIGGKYRIVLRDVDGLSLSAVGSGRVWIAGLGGDDGSYSLDGAPFRSLPNLFAGPYTFGL